MENTFRISVLNKRVVEMIDGEPIGKISNSSINWEKDIDIKGNLTRLHIARAFEDLLGSAIKDPEEELDGCNTYFYIYTRIENANGDPATDQDIKTYEVSYSIYTDQIIHVPAVPYQTGIKCEKCIERFAYYDEATLFAGEDVVIEVIRNYPDWNKALCKECAEKEGLM